MKAKNRWTTYLLTLVVAVTLCCWSVGSDSVFAEDTVDTNNTEVQEDTEDTKSVINEDADVFSAEESEEVTSNKIALTIYLDDSVKKEFTQEELAQLVKTDKYSYSAFNSFPSANIISDIIIGFAAPLRSHITENGLFICSGVVLERAGEVRDALLTAGFTLLKEEHRGEWAAFLCRTFPAAGAHRRSFRQPREWPSALRNRD